MYIDIFICIQIGPSQQKTNTHTILMSEFCQRRFFFVFFFTTEADVGVRSAVPGAPAAEVGSPGREKSSAPPKHQRGRGGEERALSHDVSAFSNQNTDEKKNQKFRIGVSAPVSDDEGGLSRLWKALVALRGERRATANRDER